MTVDGATELFVKALLVAAKVAGPALLVTLIVGLVIGVLQAATQVNEASISFVAKLVFVMATVVALGSWSLRQLVDYTTRTIGAISGSRPVNPLDGLLRAEIALFFLECARVTGVVIVAPLSWVNAPNRLKVTLVLLLTFVAHGASARAIVPNSLIEVGLALAVELVVGIAMGFVVANRGCGR
ncbi:MAG: flagellar biosynthetic protein FliQ [Polyangiaceae bacterium]